MPDSSPHASCCASLRQTLLQGWQQTFPLHASPFRQMAARSGSTPRELLGVCQELHRNGALQSIQPCWGDGLRRERWRFAFEPVADGAALAAALAALPGCIRVERCEPQPGMPTLWAEIEALDEAALARQLQRLQHQPSARLRLPSPPADTSLTCDDPRLAERLEEGLQLCSRPFAECSRQLGCSEYKLLAKLQAWRRGHQLLGLALKPAPTRVPQPGVLALWKHIEPPAASLARLQAHANVDRLVSAPGMAAWPWRLSLVLLATPQLAMDQLRELVADAGLRMPDQHARLQIDRPRDQALLFRTQVAAQPCG
ncbi:hypothetical protein [Roseateles saccharophilus]|uniref:Uncharacterized protein n=1 Tax=Roseateles saccharophilus TaxID=304 RepID=A0A4R3V1F5_ROSSA|nr:hypothetical protein [Roseateles saccharophilus]MDG0832314.1 hypothetical protein [Roseateles saccharophilus]TCU97008.1 hypothetical protein EV671_101219 [Roseateles saccharophilus]